MQHLSVPLLVHLRTEAAIQLGGDCSEEDLLQEVLWHAWSDLPRMNLPTLANFRAWVFGIARHVVLDRVKNQGAKRRSGGRHIESAVGPQGVIMDTATSVSSIACRHEEVDRLCRAIASLHSAEATIVQAYHIEGLSLAELAARLGISKTTAWSRLSEATQSLRRAYDAA